MKFPVLIASALFIGSASAHAADTLCSAVADTALYADAALANEVRPIFQFDGAQFVPSATEGEALFGMAYDVRMQPMLEENTYVRAEDWACEVLAVADDAEGGVIYDVSKDACQQEFSDTRVTFSGSSITFYESSCDITAEEAGSGGARLLTLQCYGEGSEWPAKATVTTLADLGVEMKVDEYSQTYVPCN